MRILACSIGGAAAAFLAGCLPDPPAGSGGEESGAADPEPLRAEVAELLAPEPEFVPDESVSELTIDKTAQVSILGYHDFTTGASSNPMIINIDKFREQMQALQDAGIPVISLDDFLAWRRGEKDIPDPSVVITIDDGWKSTHTLAYPILREFGYPFTLFLYPKYVDGGGRALTAEQIREMLAGGASIGSHSFSHPLPSRVHAEKRKGGESYDDFIVREMELSKKALEEKFGVDVNVFAYPGGLFTERMLALNAERGWYDAMFTCNPKRTNWDTPLEKLHRFIIHGNDEGNFKLATAFPGFGAGVDQAGTFQNDENGVPLVALSPEDRASVARRRPVVEADFSRLGGIDPGSARMTVSGFGEVPADYHPETGVLSFTPRQRLRADEYRVTVRFTPKGESEPRTLGWKFSIDRLPHYLPASGSGD